MSDFDLALSIALGVGLAAATGFRVFLPMLVVSAAAYTGHLPLVESFAWLGTPAALIMLGVAAVVEILAYYISGVDNLLDTLATPAAVVAGTLVTCGGDHRPATDGEMDDGDHCRRRSRRSDTRRHRPVAGEINRAYGRHR